MTTLEEIESIDSTMLVATDVAGFLHIDAQDIRRQAQDDKETGINRLGFPTVVSGTRVKIPKIPFIKFMRGEA